MQAELSVVAALMPPDDFDVALMRVRLSLKRSLTVRFVFDGLFSASGLGVYRSSAAHPVLGPICCRLVLRSSTAQPVLGPMLLQACASRYFYSRGRTPMASCCARWPVAVPHSRLLCSNVR